MSRKTAFPVKSFKKLWHVGTMDISKKRPDSHEGQGLSVSTHPEAWEKINEFTAGAHWELTKPGNRFFDFHSMNKTQKEQLIAWGVEQGYVRPQVKWRTYKRDEDGSSLGYFEFDTLEEALEEAGYKTIEEADEDDVKIKKDFKGLSPTPKFYTKMGEKFSQAFVLDFLAIVYAEDVLHLDGVWWADRLNVSKYSAPRGVIFNSMLSSWKAVNTSLTESLNNHRVGIAHVLGVDTIPAIVGYQKHINELHDILRLSGLAANNNLLKEGKQVIPVSKLYHGTSMSGIVGILKDNALYEGVHWGRKGEPHGPRLTKSFKVAETFAIEGLIGHPSEGAIIEFDGFALARDFKLRDYNDVDCVGNEWDTPEEEVVVLAKKVPNIRKYITAIYLKDFKNQQAVLDYAELVEGEGRGSAEEWVAGYQKLLRDPLVKKIDIKESSLSDKTFRDYLKEEELLLEYDYNPMFNQFELDACSKKFLPSQIQPKMKEIIRGNLS